jgi:hypothetical protein
MLGFDLVIDLKEVCSKLRLDVQQWEDIGVPERLIQSRWQVIENE